MYLANFSFSTVAKNKVEEAFSEYLKTINRELIQDNDIEEFKKTVLKEYDFICELNPRCKPIKKDFGTGYSFEGDFVLYGSNATFYLLKSKS